MADSDRKKRDRAMLVATLAAGKTIREASAVSGISESTIYRRLRNPKFLEELDAARREIVARAIGNLSGAAVDAVATLRLLLTSAKSDGVRLGAARLILELGAKFREDDALRQRIENIEKRMQEKKS